MITTICTLFEGGYHVGLGAFVNSLYRNGYRGIVWAGYRGALPPWAAPIVQHDRYQEFEVAYQCVIRFVPLETKTHFSNYKPDFMLSLLENYGSEFDQLYYFDPDIFIKCKWSVFEEWATHGVALCEDINPSLTSTHPVRMQWRTFAESHDMEFKRDSDIYVNGGFIGINKTNVEFLRIWDEIQRHMIVYIGGGHVFLPADRTYIFHRTDQDALNIAIMFSELVCSVMGKEGMDFIPGGYTMAHAVGEKPWKKDFVRSALMGIAPTAADKLYVANMHSPIKLYGDSEQKQMRGKLKVAAAIGRFIRRS